MNEMACVLPQRGQEQAKEEKSFPSYGYLIRREPVIACPIRLGIKPGSKTGNKRVSADMAQNHSHARA